MSPNDDKTDDDDRLITIKRKQKYFPLCHVFPNNFLSYFLQKRKIINNKH
jgi:hypothetical protein